MKKNTNPGFFMLLGEHLSLLLGIWIILAFRLLSLYFSLRIVRRYSKKSLQKYLGELKAIFLWYEKEKQRAPFFTNKKYRKAVIKHFVYWNFTSTFWNPKVLINWLTEDSWWIVAMRVWDWAQKRPYKIAMNLWSDLVDIYTYGFLRISYVPLKKNWAANFLPSAEDTYDKKDIRVNKNDFLFPHIYVTYFGEDDYISEWASSEEYKNNFPLYTYYTSMALRLLYVRAYKACLKGIKLTLRELEWKQHWASRYMSEKTYLTLETIFFKVRLFLLKEYPIVAFFVFHIYNVFSGLLMIKEAFKDAWEDYYVFNVKDERDLAHKGLVFLMTRNYRGYIPKHFGIFFHNFFKFLKEFRKFLMADLSLGVSALVLLIDIVTKPIFVFYRSKSSFIFFYKKAFVLPYIRVKKYLTYIYLLYQTYGIKQGIHVYYFNYFLKAWTQMGKVSMLGMPTRTKKILDKIKALSTPYDFQVDLEEEEYILDLKDKKKLVDYVYQGFNNTFLFAINLICDEEELREYYARKHKKREIPRGFATVWQFRNNWRFLKSWRIFNEDADNYGMDAGKAEIAEARNKRNFWDTLHLFWRSFYFWFYTWYVHKTKLEFWLRPFVEGVRWILYVFLAPIYYIYFFLRHFCLPVLIWLKELWFNLGEKLTRFLYIWGRQKAEEALKKDKSIFVCKFWAFYFPDLLDCIRGFFKLLLLYFLLGIALIFVYDDIIYFIRHWPLWFSSYINFISVVGLFFNFGVGFLCRDFREVFYEEFEDIFIWWFHLVYMGMMFHFVWMPGDVPDSTLWMWNYWRKKGHNMLGSLRIMQSILPHYRRSYLPPFN